MRRLAAAPLAAALALAACGGDDDKGPSKDEFVQKADAICAKSDREGEAIAKRSFENPKKPTPEEAQAAIREAVPMQKEALAELKALEEPEGDEQTLDEYYAAIEKGITTFETAAEDPQLSLELLAAGDAPFAEANELAKEYGMKDCAD
ncbi:MAG TPA: hypothetical protein VF712_17550 [Thermoleophilaceae bacterium]